MNLNMNSGLREAMRLMKTGDLQAATRIIQGSLGAQQARQTPDAPVESDALEASFRVVDDATNPAGGTDRTEPASAGTVPGTGFTRHHFTCNAGSLDYKLFLPKGMPSTGLPLIVMLHGCTQSPDDFARGTRMNTLAEAHGYAVLYPAQGQRRNASRCWNWFRPEDQERGRGEPAVIAAMTEQVVATHDLDARRVYVAGLSAGGAMAAVLGTTYPDVYAAAGVHSGLPTGAARDLPSALAAMKQPRAPRDGAPRHNGPRIPTIVFHGDRDTVVHPCNGPAVIAQCVAGEPAGMATDTRNTRVEQGAVPGGRRYTRTLFLEPDATVAAEEWVIHGAPHAWSGGDASGSYTDPTGPDASAQMLRFFAGHTRPAAR